MLYELATLSLPLLFAAEASAGAHAYVCAPEAKGQLLGCWKTDIGTLRWLLVLRLPRRQRPGHRAPPRASRRKPVQRRQRRDGATHIWPYSGVAERFAIRAKPYADGILPPWGGPEDTLEATSTIALPKPFSPLP